MRHVIIGASAAGIAAAKKIRQRSPNVEMMLISQDNSVYSRVKLHQMLSGEKSINEIGFVSADFFEANSIIWEKGEEVVKVIPKEKKVLLKDSREIAYDKLLIASGAEAFIPPIPHFREANNVFGLRTAFDATKIIKATETRKKCIIIGSGLVGLDAASALARRGISVTLVEMADRLSPLQLDMRAALAYQSLFEENGCHFYFSVKAANTEIDKNGDVTGLILEDGRILDCDFIVTAAGVRPTIAFLEGSGIAFKKGVAVDERMCTNVQDIYAAGDAAGIVGFWMGASKQGEVAGENMAGEDVVYVKEEPRFAMNYYGLSTVSIGGVLPQNGQTDLFQEGRNYRRVTISDGKVVHVLLQGDISKAMMWQKVVKEGLPWTTYSE